MYSSHSILSDFDKYTKKEPIPQLRNGAKHTHSLSDPNPQKTSSIPTPNDPNPLPQCIRIIFSTDSNHFFEGFGSFFLGIGTPPQRVSLHSKNASQTKKRAARGLSRKFLVPLWAIFLYKVLVRSYLQKEEHLVGQTYK